jgi:hypothetical protein
MKFIIASLLSFVAIGSQAQTYDSPDAQTLVVCDVEIKELGITQLEVVRDSSDGQIQFVLLSRTAYGTLDQLIPTQEYINGNIFIGSFDKKDFHLVSMSGKWNVRNSDARSVIEVLPCR